MSKVLAGVVPKEKVNVASPWSTLVDTRVTPGVSSATASAAACKD
jgi:precorrin-4 methylase